MSWAEDNDYGYGPKGPGLPESIADADMRRLVKHFHSGVDWVECSHSEFAKPCHAEAAAVRPLVESIIAAREAAARAAGRAEVLAEVEALANARSDGGNVVRLTQRGRFGGVCDVTDTYVLQGALRALVARLREES